MKTTPIPQPAPLASASLNSKERKAQRLLAHYATCERLAAYVLQLNKPELLTPFEKEVFRIDGKKISVALFKAERLGQQRAERMCSDPSYGPAEQDHHLSQVRVMVHAALGTLPPGFFVNSNPRGYALKIDNETPEGKALIETVGLQRDLGGFGLLSPEINGDR